MLDFNFTCETEELQSNPFWIFDCVRAGFGENKPCNLQHKSIILNPSIYV
ncbi:MAG: hypothetical protein ACI8ZM_004324 [Crocinitomix sp.]|jgi:hypothetical protein